ncbi:SLOG family protein [Persephonella sp.]
MKQIFIDKEIWSYKKDPTKVYVAIIGTSKATEDFYNKIKEKVLNYLQNNSIPLEKVVFVSGGAKGVDKMAEKLADELGKDIIVIRPDYKKHYHKQAPLERDKRIAGFSDLVIAFYRIYGSSKGTDFTVNHAIKIGKKVKKFYLKL